MAPRRHGRRNCALVAVYDGTEGREAYLVFRFNLKGLFSARSDQTPEPRPLPSPVARFPILRRADDMVFAASPCCTKVLAVTDSSRTIVYDTARSESRPGPDLRADTFDPVLLPVGMGGGGRREMFVTGTYPFNSPVPGPSALPLPPFPFADDGQFCRVGSYFDAGGGRAWVSVHMKGTYSLDMARRAWRKEGGWELPVRGRAVYDPELGLLFGLSCGRLCACDVRARPPVVLGEWGDLHPVEEDEFFYRYPVFFSNVAMAYLGGGRFCISWSSTTAPAGHPFTGRVLALRAVEVTRSASGGELQLRKHKSRCYPHVHGPGNWSRLQLLG